MLPANTAYCSGTSMTSSEPVFSKNECVPLLLDLQFKHTVYVYISVYYVGYVVCCCVCVRLALSACCVLDSQQAVRYSCG